MTHPLSTIYLTVAAIFLAGSGVYALARPQGFAAALDLTTLRAGGLNEVRAQYGGFFFVLGVVCGLAAFGSLPRRFGLGAAALTFGGVASGRLLSLAMDRGVKGYGPGVRALIPVDAASCALAVAALLLEP